MDMQTFFQTVGGASRVANILGLHRSVVTRWEKVPPRHLVKIEEHFGIPREQLCPELFAGVRVVRTEPEGSGENV